MDREDDLATPLRAARPDLLIDASGPFQLYGRAPYRLIEVCLELGIDYVDLADDAAFVAGVDAFDDAARRAGVCILSGLSTCPALTAAVVSRLAEGLDRVDAIRAGIAPSPYTRFGPSVVRALASYAGRRPMGGEGHCLTDGEPLAIAPPGVLPLEPRLFTQVETPDAAVLPRLWPGASVWVGFGVGQVSLQRMLMLLAQLVRLRVLPQLTPMAPVFRLAINALRWGEDRGGMFVHVRGKRDGETCARTWNLIAEGDSGPFIPTLAAVALVRRRTAGVRVAAGARHAAGAVTLADYEPLFAELGIVAGMRDEPPSGPVFRQVLGAALDALPAAVVDLHDGAADRRYEGRADVERGRGPLAALLAALIGFPRAAADVPVSVEITHAGGRETWRRVFDGRAFESVLSPGPWGLLSERFGPVRLGIALVRDGPRLRYDVRRWSVFGAPAPRWLRPGGDTFETETDGRFRFDVEIGAPLIGRIVRYRGWLQPVSPAAPAPE